MNPTFLRGTVAAAVFALSTTTAFAQAAAPAANAAPVSAAAPSCVFQPIVDGISG
jgi:hypothetical protein